MNQPQENSSSEEKRKPGAGRPLRLPFTNRRQDAGGWVYDHRIGLCVTIIIYLVFGIAFISSKILLNSRAPYKGMVIDIQNVEALEKERDRLLEELKKKNSSIDWKSIRNVSSNENALNENLKDEKGTNTAQLNASAEEVERNMRLNREAYEQGLREAQKAGERGEETKKQEKSTDRHVKGTVTVSFSLVNPIRYSRHLVKPAYRCEGGGDVTVRITVSRSGEVIHAQVVSGGDECMRQTAVESALNSQFDINESAPERQQGTITYVFIPQ